MTLISITGLSLINPITQRAIITSWCHLSQSVDILIDVYNLLVGTVVYSSAVQSDESGSPKSYQDLRDQLLASSLLYDTCPFPELF